MGGCRFATRKRHLAGVSRLGAWNFGKLDAPYCASPGERAILFSTCPGSPVYRRTSPVSWGIRLLKLTLKQSCGVELEADGLEFFGQP